MEKSKVRVFQNRCGRKIKAKTANGQNERKEEIRGGWEKSQSSYGLWRRRSVLICFQVVLPERISHFVPACLQSQLFVSASRGCLMTHLYDALLLLQLCSAIQLQPAGSLRLQRGDDDAWAINLRWFQRVRRGQRQHDGGAFKSSTAVITFTLCSRPAARKAPTHASEEVLEVILSA